MVTLWNGPPAAAGGRIYVAGDHAAEAVVHPDARDGDREYDDKGARQEGGSDHLGPGRGGAPYTNGDTPATMSEEARAVLCASAGILDPIWIGLGRGIVWEGRSLFGKRPGLTSSIANW